MFELSVLDVLIFVFNKIVFSPLQMYKTAEKFFLICAVLTALLLVCNSMYIQRDDAPDGLDRYLEMKRGQMMMRDMDLLEESLKRGGRCK